MISTGWGRGPSSDSDKPLTMAGGTRDLASTDMCYSYSRQPPEREGGGGGGGGVWGGGGERDFKYYCSALFGILFRTGETLSM